MRISIFIALAITFVFILGCKKETQVTPGGYEYIVQKATNGAKPNVGDYVYFHAQARIGDSVLYASRTQGAAPYISIPGEDQDANAQGQRKPSPVEEVLKLMAEGDSVTVLINLDSLPSKPSGFEKEKFMYYDVVCVDIQTPDEFQQTVMKQREEERIKREAAMAREPEIAAATTDMINKYVAGQLNDQIKTTANGLKYIIQDPGKGKQAEKGKVVSVHYYGALADGKRFDSSFGSTGMPYTFNLGQGMVIPGWDEGIPLLKEGGKAMLFIPAELAYGAAGSPPVIPANAELIFYVELDKVIN